MTAQEQQDEFHDIRDAVAKLCAQFPGEYWRKLDRQMAYPKEFVDALTEAGYLSVLIPEEYGGSGLKLSAAAAILEEIQRAGCNGGGCHAQMYTMGTVLRHGNDAQKAKYLPGIASGKLRLQAFGVTEPTSGTDTSSLKTVAKRDGDHYIVNGQKIWTTTAHLADWVFALVRTDPEARKQEGISFLLIDLRTPGITIRPIRSIDGEHHLNEVFFDEVRVPVANLVGQEHKGWDCAKFLLSNERTGIANVGLCRERLDHARELAGRQLQAGRLLLDDPKLRTEIAVLEAETRALEITNWRFLLTEAEQQRLPAFASVLKLKGTELQQEINALLARIAGPGGLERRPAHEVAHGPLTPRYFYSRAASIYGGTTEVQKDILAKAIVG
jgi:pimeloyl-CoA dehydrogenase